MKSYQDHCPIADKGKAAPHPKRPTSYTYRNRGCSISVDTIALQEKRKETRKAEKGSARKYVGIFAAVLALIPRRRQSRTGKR